MAIESEAKAVGHTSDSCMQSLQHCTSARVTTLDLTSLLFALLKWTGMRFQWTLSCARGGVCAIESSSIKFGTCIYSCLLGHEDEFSFLNLSFVDKFDDFWSINKKMMLNVRSEPEPFKSIPFSIYRVSCSKEL